MRLLLICCLTSSALVAGSVAVAQHKPVPPLRLDSRPLSDSFGDSGQERLNQAAARQEKTNQLKRRRRLQWEDNAAHWRGQVEQYPGTAFYYRRLLYTLKHLGRCDEILDIGSRLLVIDPVDSYGFSIIGSCHFEVGRYDKALNYLEPSVWYNPTDFQTQRVLGYCFYRLRKYPEAAVALKRAVDLEPHDFGANYWLGWSFIESGKMTDAVQPLVEAARLRPSDYWANHTSGWVLLKAGRYAEAIAHLEKALELRKDARETKILLFTGYVFTGDFGKASALFPLFVTAMAVVLTGFYLLGLTPLLIFSFRHAGSAYPNIFFSLGWLVVFAEGQIAFIFLLAQIPCLKWIANPLGAILVAGLPLLLAVSGFRRQPWGEPFRWPARFGGVRVVLISILFLLGTYFLNFLLAQLSASKAPLQNTVPILQEALRATPLLSYAIIGVAIPAIEEVLFRGLLFGSSRRWLSPNWSIIVTALIFAAFHMQPAAFVQLFVLGCLLGWARARSGAVALPIFLHVLNNSLATIGLLSGKV